MTISIVGTPVFSSAQALSLTITLPSGISSGDYIILLVGNGEDAGPPAITTPPSGYTALGSLGFYDYGAGGISTQAYIRLATSSNPDPSITWNQGSTSGGGVWALATAYRSTAGWHATDPVTLLAGDFDTSSTSAPAPADFTIAAAGHVVTFLQTSDNNSSTLGAANGFTLRGGGNTTSGSDGSIHVADQALASSGTFSHPVWSLDIGPDYYSYRTILLREVSNTTLVNSDLGVSYTTNTAASADLAVSYSASEAVNADLAIAYTTTTAVAADLSAGYETAAAFDVDLRVDFNDPGGTLTGAQSFELLVRRDAANTGTGVPTIDVELWDGGGYVSTLISGQSITSDAGEIVSAPWTATDVSGTDPYGTGVECRIIGTVGGTGVNARGVDIGAVSWTAQYEESGTTTVSADLAASYATTGTVSADLAASYAAQALVTADMAASYATAALVNADLAASYQALESVDADLAASYATSATVAAELHASYQALALVSADLASSYAALEAVQADLGVSYAALELVSQVLPSSYQALAMVYADLSADYDADGYGVVGSNMVASYATLAAVTSDLAGAWQALQVASADLPASYLALASVSADLAASHSAMAFTSSDLAANYTGQELVGASLSASYDAEGYQVASADLAVSWSSLAAVAGDLAVGYSAEAYVQVAGDLSVTYQAIETVQADQVVAYQALQAAAADLAIDYQASALVGSSVAIDYTALAMVSASLSASWSCGDLGKVADPRYMIAARPRTVSLAGTHRHTVRRGSTRRQELQA